MIICLEVAEATVLSYVILRLKGEGPTMHFISIILLCLWPFHFFSMMMRFVLYSLLFLSSVQPFKALFVISVCALGISYFEARGSIKMRLGLVLGVGHGSLCI